MKLSTILVLLLFILHCTVISQSFNIEWQSCFGGTDTEYPNDIIAVPGGYLVIGETKSNNGDISFNHGLTDGWVFKINNLGEIIWEKSYGGSGGEGCRRIIPDSFGNYYLVGASKSDDGDISYDPYPNSWDCWIVKIDIDGNIIWEKILGGTGDEVLWTGTATNDGGVVALAWTTSNDGDVTSYYGLYDVWMVKLNSDGEKEWDFTIGTEGFDVGQAIIQTSDGGFLVGCASIIGEGGNLTCEPFNSFSEAVLVKLDSNLNIEWQQCYGGSNHDGVTALAEVSDGYIFGGYASSNDGDISGWHGEGDIWVVKVDFFGIIIWQKCLGGSNSEFLYKILITDDEDIIIPGTTRSTDGDVTGNHTISEYEHDIWVVKLSSEGELLWEQCFGGIWDDQVNFGFIKKGDNNFVIAGQTDYGPSFDVACTPYGGNYDRDFWVFEIKDTTTNVIVDELNNFAIKVYPNPARNFVVFEADIQDFEFSIYREEGRIQVANVIGEKIIELQVNTNKTVWDTRNVQDGIYFYNMEIGNWLVCGKVVIQK